jgi:lysophospholipase L1-like esterase
MTRSSANNAGSGSGHWGANVVLLLFSCCFALVVGEIFLRAIGYAPEELHLFRDNPNGTGSYRLRPNLNVVTRSGKSIKTNSHGMRWREIPLVHPEVKKRIAFVGDSFTFGLWANTVEECFVSVFEHQLGPDKFEALNFGVPGFGFLDIELLLQEEVFPFRPDCVVLMSYNGNDFFDTYLGPDRYHVARNGVLSLNRKALEQKVPADLRRKGFKFQRSLLEHVYLLRLVNAGLKSALGPRSLKSREPAGADRSYTSNLFWSQKHYPRFALDAKNSSLEALNRISQVCKQNGIELRIAAIPSIEQVLYPEVLGEDYVREFPQEYLREFAEKNSLPFLDLLPGLSRDAREHGQELYDRVDGHFSNEGHRVVGTLLASFFKDDQ